jgi:hypothetical protein
MLFDEGNFDPLNKLIGAIAVGVVVFVIYGIHRLLCWLL